MRHDRYFDNCYTDMNEMMLYCLFRCEKLDTLCVSQAAAAALYCIHCLHLLTMIIATARTFGFSCLFPIKHIVVRCPVV